MKKSLSVFLFLCSLFALSSCIQDEPLNAECDITGLCEEWLEANKAILLGNPIITNDRVTIQIKDNADVSALNPMFILTEGARITAEVDGVEVLANGITRNFNRPQAYTVHSQDGKWHKKYEVAFVEVPPLSLLSFEYYDLERGGRFYQWYEVNPENAENPRLNCWSSGNPGYAMSGMAKSPSDYPTAPDPIGKQGNCIRLVTKDTGAFGMMLSNKMPIAAGNLFIGTFNTVIATKSPRKATAFGLQMVGNTAPLTLEGYYKYTAGPNFTDEKKKPVAGKKDMADIYAVVYEAFVTGENGESVFTPLDGDNILNSERIVMIARIDDPGEPQEWQYFSEPFRPMNEKTFDEAIAREDGYAIAVVATSSRDGAYFRGAIGSTLYVDELKITWK